MQLFKYALQVQAKFVAHLERSLYRGGGSTFKVVRPVNDKLEVIRPYGNNDSFLSM